MPFEQYIQDPAYDNSSFPTENDIFSSSPLFQLPQYIYESQPFTAPGGGAEVVQPHASWNDNRSPFTQDSAFRSQFFTSSPVVHPSAEFVSPPLFNSPPSTIIPPAVSRAGSGPTSLSGPRPHTILESAYDDGAGLYEQQAVNPWPPPVESVVPANTITHGSSCPPFNPAITWTGFQPPLPMYSSSGFDCLPLLARVVHRPRPAGWRDVLGPVDISCAFVVCDRRKRDMPIVYVSPEFERMTGYDSTECVGRNCRFLQTPYGKQSVPGEVQASREQAVENMRRAFVEGSGKGSRKLKECQVSVVNYRKNGEAFMNLVTVVPLGGGEHGYDFPHNYLKRPFYEDGDDDCAGIDEEDVVWLVGFQVDLAHQSDKILGNVKAGRYTSTSTQPLPPPPPPRMLANPYIPLPNQNSQQQPFAHHHVHPTSSGRDKKVNPIPQMVMSERLRAMLADPEFLRSIPITTITNVPTIPSQPPATSVATGGASSTALYSVDSSAVTSNATNTSITGGNHLLSLILLEASPDFVHVVSLKGSFLYVAPSVRRVLGYEPQELVGKSLADLAHKEDVVPLMRELKESSSGVGPGGGNNEEGEGIVGSAGMMTMQGRAPKVVDLLFRARVKSGAYVWVECRGKLHVEPGKGRKAIILNGRAKQAPSLTWGTIARMEAQCGLNSFEGLGRTNRKEFWATVGPRGRFLSVTASVESVLGYKKDQVAGWRIGRFLAMSRGLEAENARKVLEEDEGDGNGAMGMANVQRAPKAIQCWMRKNDGEEVKIVAVLYPPEPTTSTADLPLPVGVSPPPLVAQFRLLDDNQVVNSATGSVSAIPAKSYFPPSANVFEELDVSRGSSWQYELQQLKFENRRLAEEIEELESRRAQQKQGFAFTTTSNGAEVLKPAPRRRPASSLAASTLIGPQRDRSLADGPPTTTAPLASPASGGSPLDYFIQRPQHPRSGLSLSDPTWLGSPSELAPHLKSLKRSWEATR